MQFSSPAPGTLSVVGSDYIGRWEVAPDNFGYSAAQVASWVSGALNDPNGWGRAGVSFQQVSDGPVTFIVVQEINFPGGAGDTIGLATPFEDGTWQIQLEAGHFGNDSLVMHEAAHAFFTASHSPQDSDSIMEPLIDAPTEDPSDTDIDQVRAWLGLPATPGGPPRDPEPPKALPPRVYWHPLDLEYYITKRDLSGETEVRLTVAVPIAREAGVEAGNTLKAVYATDLSDMDPTSSAWSDLGAEVSFGSAGFFDSGWGALQATGEKYVGLTITTHGVLPRTGGFQVRDVVDK